MFRIVLRLLALAVFVVPAAAFAGTAQARTAADAYTVNPLVSDSSATPAAATDPSLVNAWGLSVGPTTPWWVSDNGTNLSTLYSGTGAKTPLTVSVPGGPTGTVFNGSASDFVVSQGAASGASRFLFATEGGTILGWTPSVNGTVAIVGADRSSVGAVYKGLTTANDRLYATDFHNGRVDVFDSSFKLVTTPGAFTDAKVAKGFAPFGIQAIGNDIFVTYAKQDAAKHDDVAVPGQAYVDEFTPDGQLVARVVNSGQKNAPLNAPWGLALAPAGFGSFGGDLLVGNFGDGRISAYTQRGSNWVYKGQLRSADGMPVVIDGLWALAFGNGSAAGPTDSLYFAAGPSGEQHGLFGSITAD
ncbi:MAG TPA: TIGR03118 family protein [Gaiellaceae bacterium]|nr:TIGR03118 family protein [Gaiellaceae bacterium]